MVVPTADALGKGDWNAGIFFENVDNQTINDYVINYGIAQGFEIDIDRFRLSDEKDAHTLLNAKYKFMAETAGQPAIAAGIADITDEIETTVYAVASKTFGTDLRAYKGETLNTRVHIGFGGGRISGLFVGGSTYFGNRVQLIAEWDTIAVNVGMRWRVTPEFTVHLGGFNLNDKQNDRFSAGASFGVGTSYNMTY